MAASIAARISSDRSEADRMCTVAASAFGRDSPPASPAMSDAKAAAERYAVGWEWVNTAQRTPS